MWISRKEYDRLVERLDKLEKATRVTGNYNEAEIGHLVYLLMAHMGLQYTRHPERYELEKKGGPERGF